MTERPAETHAAARERSWRTFAQGLAIDVAVALVLVLAAAVGDLEWTTAFWTAVGTSAAKSVIQAAVAYAMRVWVKPRTETAE